MGLVSNNSDTTTVIEGSTAPLEKDLASVLKESQEAISSSIPKTGKKRGRKSAAEKEAIKAAESLPPPPVEIKPAGLAPMIKPVIHMGMDGVASYGGAPELEFDDKAAEMLAEQGDLVLGAFCPDVANSKWGALTAFAVSLTMVGYGHYRSATQLRDKKIAKMKKDAEIQNEPTQVGLSTLVSGNRAPVENPIPTML